MFCLIHSLYHKYTFCKRRSSIHEKHPMSYFYILILHSIGHRNSWHQKAPTRISWRLTVWTWAAKNPDQLLSETIFNSNCPGDIFQGYTATPPATPAGPIFTPQIRKQRYGRCGHFSPKDMFVPNNPLSDFPLIPTRSSHQPSHPQPAMKVYFSALAIVISTVEHKLASQ